MPLDVIPEQQRGVGAGLGSPWVLLMPTEALSPPSSEGCRWSCQAFSQGQNRNRSHLGAGGRRAGAGRRHLCRGRGPWALANPPLASGRGFLDLVTSPPPLVCHHGGFRTYYVPGPEHLLCAWPRAVKTHSILQAGKQAESTARAAVGCGVRAHHSGSRAGLPNPWTALLPV